MAGRSLPESGEQPLPWRRCSSDILPPSNGRLPPGGKRPRPSKTRPSGQATHDLRRQSRADAAHAWRRAPRTLWWCAERSPAHQARLQPASRRPRIGSLTVLNLRKLIVHRLPVRPEPVTVAGCSARGGRNYPNRSPTASAYVPSIRFSYSGSQIVSDGSIINSSTVALSAFVVQ